MRVKGVVAMEYTMRLAEKPFDRIKNGLKKIEMRLFDEKRKKIRIGDTILFSKQNSPGERLSARVTDIYTYASFEELYKALPLQDLGYVEEEMALASPRDMAQFYSPEEEARYGVVGFRLEVFTEPQNAKIF